MKLAVLIPWESPFMFSAFTESALNMRGAGIYDMRWFFGRGDNAASRHTDVLEQAIEWNADLVCFLSADQVYPEDLFERLVGRVGEGRRAISAVVPMRGYVEGQGSKPFEPMAWRLDKSDPLSSATKFIPIDVNAGDVQPIDIIGSGVLMFPASAAKRMKKPWFEYVNDPNKSNRSGGCDSKFVWRLNREAGLQVYVDTTIKVKHLNVFSIDETYQERFSDWINGGGDTAICRYKEKVNVESV